MSLLSKALLFVPSKAYHAVQKTWPGLFRLGILSAQSAPVPVISVGNIVMGGSGKTPFVIYLARLLWAQGLRPAVISRGYGGSYKGPHLVVGDGSGPPLAVPAASGDEPYLIATRLPDVPVLVARKRMEGVRAAGELFGIDSIILDDGFQHLALRRDVDIVLLNGREDRMFPSGCLREPFSALDRAHIIVLSGAETVIPAGAKRHVLDKPVFRCRQIAIDLLAGIDSGIGFTDRYAGREVILASAIANPERFRAIATNLGWKPVEHLVFRDHHRFTDQELRLILDRANGLPVIVTEKDWVKLPEWFRQKDQAAALRINITLEDEDGFIEALMNRVHTKMILRK